MTDYLIGDIIKATSTVFAGDTHSIVEYEWTWDNVILTDEKNSSIIDINTIDKTVGGKVLSLRVLNDCGEWSTKSGQTINLILPTGNISISNCLSGYTICSFIQGDIINIGYSGLNFTSDGSIIVVDADSQIRKTWDLTASSGTLNYTTIKSDPLGIWYLDILYKGQALMTENSGYKEFELIYYCPIPIADFVLS